MGMAANVHERLRPREGDPLERDTAPRGRPSHPSPLAPTRFSPDAHQLWVLNGEGQAFRAHFAAPADFLGSARGVATFREEGFSPLASARSLANLGKEYGVTIVGPSLAEQLGLSGG